MLAVDKRTGQEVWRHQVPGGKPNFNAPSDCVGSWATPIIASVAGREQRILTLPKNCCLLIPERERNSGMPVELASSLMDRQ